MGEIFDNSTVINISLNFKHAGWLKIVFQRTDSISKREI